MCYLFYVKKLCKVFFEITYVFKTSHILFSNKVFLIFLKLKPSEKLIIKKAA